MIKNLFAIAGNVRDSSLIPGHEDPLEKGMPSHPVFLPRESHGQRSLVGYSQWGHQESDMAEAT